MAFLISKLLPKVLKTQTAHIRGTLMGLKGPVTPARGLMGSPDPYANVRYYEEVTMAPLQLKTR